MLGFLGSRRITPWMNGAQRWVQRREWWLRGLRMLHGIGKWQRRRRVWDV